MQTPSPMRAFLSMIAPVIVLFGTNPHVWNSLGGNCAPGRAGDS